MARRGRGAACTRAIAESGARPRTAAWACTASAKHAEQAAALLRGRPRARAGAHRDMVRGVRWLGASARVASFSSERTERGFRNALLLTDARSRASQPFRDVGVEAAPMLGIRAAPSGRYLLLLLRGAPSEIWAARPRPPTRLTRNARHALHKTTDHQGVRSRAGVSEQGCAAPAILPHCDRCAWAIPSRP